MVGPNGAGKTTLLKMITGLVRPTSGTVAVMNHNPGSQTGALSSIGLVIENPPSIEHLSGLRNLQLLASIKNQVATSEMVSALKQVGLNPEDRRPVKKYSLGMKQRLALAQAIMEKPQLLLLDEPTNGLDPQGVADIRNFLLQLKEQGVSILLASHLLTEVERICDEVAIIKNGEIVHRVKQKTTDGLQQVQAAVKLTALEDVRVVSQWAKDKGWEVTAERSLLRLEGVPSMPGLIKDLVNLGVSIEAVYAEDSLEITYLRVVGGMAK
ncbi:MAG: putative ABC transporter ATP-binding protein YxlF [candidate division WS2 bacterium]|nr:putative ABC transporter ATP-binding protein YxlF [Candidatus Psychracetigena formicireducens]